MALGDLPAEILEEIILVIIAHSPLGLPLELAALLLTSRAIYTKLSPHNFPHLHSRVFMSKFDPPCALLSLGSVDGINLPSSHDLTQELRARFSALKLFTAGRLDDPEFSDALMTAFIMTLEDAGRNAAQLRHSGLPRLLREYICTRLRDDALTSTHGWPAQSHINSVILYLFWALSSESCVATEDTDTRGNTMQALAPVAFAAFRYPCSSLPEHQFCSDQLRYDASVASMSPPPHVITYLGRPVCVRPPPLACAAILAFFARVERQKIEVPEFLPRTRAIANTMGIRGPTQEDVVEYRDVCRTRFPERHTTSSLNPSISKVWEADRFRFVSDPTLSCSPRAGAYTLGTLSGRWTGSVLIPCRTQYANMLANPAAPTSIEAESRVPLFVTFKEHYCIDSRQVLPNPEPVDGIKHAWLPERFFWSSRGGHLQVSDGGQFEGVYTTFSDGMAPPNEVADVMLTGETEERHAQAWGAFRWTGRVRLCDGFIVLLRESTDPQILHTAIFKGYVVSSHNFVGRWMDVSPGTSPSEYEAIWSLSRLEHNSDVPQ